MKPAYRDLLASLAASTENAPPVATPAAAAPAAACAQLDANLHEQHRAALHAATLAAQAAQRSAPRQPLGSVGNSIAPGDCRRRDRSGHTPCPHAAGRFPLELYDCGGAYHTPACHSRRERSPTFGHDVQQFLGAADARRAHAASAERAREDAVGGTALQRMQRLHERLKASEDEVRRRLGRLVNSGAAGR